MFLKLSYSPIIQQGNIDLVNFSVTWLAHHVSNFYFKKAFAGPFTVRSIGWNWSVCFLENEEQHIDFLPREQDRRMGGVYHRDVYWRVASKGGNALLIIKFTESWFFEKILKTKNFGRENFRIWQNFGG